MEEEREKQRLGEGGGGNKRWVAGYKPSKGQGYLSPFTKKKQKLRGKRKNNTGKNVTQRKDPPKKSRLLMIRRWWWFFQRKEGIEKKMLVKK